jgi:hypothetical protein
VGADGVEGDDVVVRPHAAAGRLAELDQQVLDVLVGIGEDDRLAPGDLGERGDPLSRIAAHHQLRRLGQAQARTGWAEGTKHGHGAAAEYQEVAAAEAGQGALE